MALEQAAIIRRAVIGRCRQRHRIGTETRTDDRFPVGLVVTDRPFKRHQSGIARRADQHHVGLDIDVTRMAGRQIEITRRTETIGLHAERRHGLLEIAAQSPAFSDNCGRQVCQFIEDVGPVFAAGRKAGRRGLRDRLLERFRDRFRVDPRGGCRPVLRQAAPQHHGINPVGAPLPDVEFQQCLARAIQLNVVQFRACLAAMADQDLRLAPGSQRVNHRAARACRKRGLVAGIDLGDGGFLPERH